MSVTGTTGNRHKGTPQSETIQKPADFIPIDPKMTPQGPPSTKHPHPVQQNPKPSSTNPRSRQWRKCYTVHPLD